MASPAALPPAKVTLNSTRLRILLRKSESSARRAMVGVQSIRLSSKATARFAMSERSSSTRKGRFTGTVPVYDFNLLALYISESGYMELADAYMRPRDRQPDGLYDGCHERTTEDRQKLRQRRAEEVVGNRGTDRSTCSTRRPGTDARHRPCRCMDRWQLLIRVHLCSSVASNIPRRVSMARKLISSGSAFEKTARLFAGGGRWRVGVRLRHHRVRLWEDGDLRRRWRSRCIRPSATSRRRSRRPVLRSRTWCAPTTSCRGRRTGRRSRPFSAAISARSGRPARPSSPASSIRACASRSR